jgi:transposase InsO family protein
VAHPKARLTPFGRRLLVRRVREEGLPVAHVAAAMGVSRQCAHRWLTRFDAEGDAGMFDRTSRPYRSPTQTPPEVEAVVVAARLERRVGPDVLGPELGVAPRTVTRILRRHGVPRLAVCDPMTGEVIRASKHTAVRYERPRPGELVHVDVKKLGRIPDGGGWRAHGRGTANSAEHKRARIGFDYVHSMVDDHSRYAYSEVLADERATATVEFMERAVTHFAERGISIQAVMTDNAWAYTRSPRFARLLADIDATHIVIKAHCPWQNGKVERFNRTLQSDWAYRQVFTTNDQRTAALDPWLETYNTQRRHSAIGGKPPISRLPSPT